MSVERNKVKIEIVENNVNSEEQVYKRPINNTKDPGEKNKKNIITNDEGVIEEASSIKNSLPQKLSLL